MITKRNLSMIASVLLLTFFLVAPVAAHNKVVVIPLMKDAPPLEPWAPVTAENPHPSAYTDKGDNGNNGDNTDDAVTDNVTGLVWQKTNVNTTRTWAQAWEYCAYNNAGLPGTGWRLPSIDELISIVAYGTNSAAINKTIFPETNSSNYWSATTRAFNSNHSWSVDFLYGFVSYSAKSNSHYVRCVRGTSYRNGLLKNNGNGTVTDMATGLTWQREDDNEERNWDNAASYCQGLPLAGGSWRLPTVKELRSIVDNQVYGPAIDGNTFPGTDLPHYWSATLYADNVNSYAWGIYFYGGNVNNNSKSNTYYVRCVR